MPARLKFDLSSHIGHKVLHDGDGARPPQLSGGRLWDRRRTGDSTNIDAQDILFAWRAFECSYFAAALLAPRTPFRQYLARRSYSILSGEEIELSKTLVMRRMSAGQPLPLLALFRRLPTRQSASGLPR